LRDARKEVGGGADKRARSVSGRGEGGAAVASGVRDMGRPRKEEGERRATRWAGPERDARGGKEGRADAAARAGPKIQEERGKEKRKNFSFFFFQTNFPKAF